MGYLVKKIEPAMEEFKRLDYQVEKAFVYDEVRKVNIAFMRNEEYRIELIAPVGKESPMYPLLAKHKNTSYHICYECANLEEEIIRLTKNYYILLLEPAIAPAIDGRKVAFLMNAAMGMIELVEA